MRRPVAAVTATEACLEAPALAGHSAEADGLSGAKSRRVEAAWGPSHPGRFDDNDDWAAWRGNTWHSGPGGSGEGHQSSTGWTSRKWADWGSPQETREDAEPPRHLRPVCHFFSSFGCWFGDKCWFNHPRSAAPAEASSWSAAAWWEASPPADHWRRPAWLRWRALPEGRGTAEEAGEAQRSDLGAGVRFVLRADAARDLTPEAGVPGRPFRGTGPQRVRVMGDVWSLGFDEGDCHPKNGLDMMWEGDQWTTCIVNVPANLSVNFCFVQLHQSESHPGVLQGTRRCEIHESRTWTTSALCTVRTPDRGQVCEVVVDETGIWREGTAAVACRREGSREEFLAFAGLGSASRWMLQPPPDGQQRCFSFDYKREDGASSKMDFSLYVPPDFGSRAPEGGWPLLVFLHSMHGRLDQDMNLFYESDTPVRLLLGHPACPRALRETFVVLSPQCDPDFARGDNAGIWLRKGWYEVSDYDPKSEASLGALIEAVAGSCRVNRQRIAITGTSMGAYAALELCKRWPGFFSAAAPVASHYDLDPVEELVDRLVEPQDLPLWFFHASNDQMCPCAPVEELVESLRSRSRAEVRSTFFEDTWSNQGHCADRVPYWATPQSPGQSALGEELFAWLASHRGAGRPRPAPAVQESPDGVLGKA